MFIFDKPPGKPQLLVTSHRIACILCAIPVAYYLLMCHLAFVDALDDWQTFSGLGFSDPFQYYLRKNTFYENLGPFLCVTAEWILYIVQCHRMEQKKPLRGSVWYFSIMLVIHVVIWLYTNALPLPDSPPYNLAELPTVHYRRFANKTIIPAIVYFVTYFLLLWKNRTKNSA